jgi:hypothetical protein
MPGPAEYSPWYLARDGQQFGPITEAEMAKLVEMGHLQPNDLLWRDGFPDWRPALVVFPQRGPSLAPGPRPTRAAPGRSAHLAGADRSGRAAADDYDRPSGGRAAVVGVLLLLVVLASGAGLAFTYSEQLAALVGSLTASSGAMGIADRKSLEAPPLAGFRAGSSEAIDASLQATALWRVIKREFPDWYAKRLDEAAALARENKDDAVVGQYVARKIVELRRQQAANGLSATQRTLKTVATAYLDALTRLSSAGGEACGGFVRQGEAEPLVVALLQGSEHTAYLQAYLTAVFEAIAEGRQLPRVHPQPTQAQYAMLAKELTAKRGWTQEDFRALSSKQSMAQAPPEKVCKLVSDFFAAHLALPDPDAQMRLLVDSLRSVFAG